MMRAILSAGPELIAYRQDVAVPMPRAGEILVRVHYAAQNPTDWKSAAVVPPGRIVGCDFAGTVVDANGTGPWLAGQRVAGWVHGTSVDPARGAFADYLTIEPSLVFAVPESVPLEAAATISLATATALQALFQRLCLPEPPAEGPGPDPSRPRVPVLIYGGATSVGLYAIQLARLAGLHVIAIASPGNHEMLKSLGADETIDYHNGYWPHLVRPREVQHALDCFAQHGSIEMCARAMSRTDGGHVITLLPSRHVELDADLAGKVRLTAMLAYTVFGKPLKDVYSAFDLGGVSIAADRAFWEDKLKLLPSWLAKGHLKPNKVRLLGGFDKIAEGFKLQEEEKVRAEKLVYRLQS